MPAVKLDLPLPELDVGDSMTDYEPTGNNELRMVRGVDSQVDHRGGGPLSFELLSSFVITVEPNRNLAPSS